MRVLVTLGVEGTTFYQRLGVTDTPAIKILAVEMGVPVNEPASKNSDMQGFVTIQNKITRQSTN